MTPTERMIRTPKIGRLQGKPSQRSDRGQHTAHVLLSSELADVGDEDCSSKLLSAISVEGLSVAAEDSVAVENGDCSAELASVTSIPQ